jgi:acetylornithine deacetylase/succinyl-diaminopimelate desuccinylase-like protein
MARQPRQGEPLVEGEGASDGVRTATFGAGQNEPHTIDEWINLDEYDRACALALQLATMR